jgi:hypothetical protein
MATIWVSAMGLKAVENAENELIKAVTKLRAYEKRMRR